MGAVYVELMTEQEPKPEIDQKLKTRPTTLTANTLDKKDLDDTDARLNRMRDVQHGTKLLSWQVGQKSQENQMVSGKKENSREYQMVSSESFTQSKKRCSKIGHQ